MTIGDPAPLQPKEALQKRESPKSPAGPEKAIATAVQVGKFRLEVAEGVPFSSLEQVQWEGTLTAVNQLQRQLHKNHIDVTNPDESRAQPLDDPRLPHEMFQEDILPNVEGLEAVRATNRADESVFSEEEIRNITAAMRQAEATKEMPTDITDLAAIKVIRMETAAQKRLVETLTSIWIHDILGQATVDKANLQMIERYKRRLRLNFSPEGDGENLPEGTEQLITDLPRITENDLVSLSPEDRSVILEAVGKMNVSESRMRGPLVKMDGILEDSPDKACAHETISAASLVDMVQKSTEESQGRLGLNLHTDIDASQLPLLSIDYNAQLAMRFIDNLADNAGKAYEDTPGSERQPLLDVELAVQDGQLIIRFGDRGHGYSDEMITRWNSSQTRETIPTGWNNKQIASHGIGFRDHTAVLEEVFGGKVTIGNREGGGALTTLSFPLKSN